MKRSRAFITGVFSLVLTAAAAVPACASGYLPGSASEGIAAGTSVINQSVATYDDGKGSNYYTTSNQLVVTIQNAPAVTITGTGSNLVAPGMTVNDVFTVANNGNATATLQIVNAAVTLPDGSSAVTPNVANTTFYNNGTPTYNSSMSIAAFNQMGISFGQGFSTSLQISYVVPFGTPVGPATTALTVALQQGSLSGYASPVAAQTATAQASASDTITTDAQLDLGTTITNAVGTYTVETDAQNSGGLNARGTAAAAALASAAGVPTTGPGALIVQKVPQCAPCTGTNAVQSTLAATPQVTTNPLNGYAGGTPVLMYNHDGTAKTWDTTSTGTVTYVGVYVPAGSDGSSVLYGTASLIDPAQSDGAAGRAPHPALTLLTTLTYPTGFHSSDSNAYSTISNGVIDGNVTNNGFYDLLGPTLPNPAGGSPLADTSTTDISAALTNGTAQALVTGASNIAYGSAPPSLAVLNGPLGHPDAAGVLDGAKTADTSGDFTAFVLLTNAQGSATQSINTALDTTTPTQTTMPPGTTYAVENTLRNMGTSDDIFDLSQTTAFTPFTGAQPLPGTWSVAFYPANADNSVGTTAITATPVVHSGDTYNYYAVYSAPKDAQLTLFTPYEAIVSATSENSLGAVSRTGTGTGPVAVSDPTIHVMFANGFVAMYKIGETPAGSCSSLAASSSDGSTAMPHFNGGTSRPGCPGAPIFYQVHYQNLAPDPAAGSGSGNISLTAKNFAVVEDGNGTANPNTPVNASNWGAFTGGLAAPATDSSTGTSAQWDGNTVGSTSFTEHVGTLSPQAGGAVRFGVIVNAPSSAAPSTPAPIQAVTAAQPATPAATPAAPTAPPTLAPVTSGGSV